jgi:hypothetical protein
VKEDKALDSGAKEDIHLEADIFFGTDSRTICELEYLQEKVKKFLLLIPTVSVGMHTREKNIHLNLSFSLGCKSFELLSLSHCPLLYLLVL